MTKWPIQPSASLPPMTEPSILPIFIGGSPIFGAMSRRAVIAAVPVIPPRTARFALRFAMFVLLVVPDALVLSWGGMPSWVASRPF
jgi:hypothetical protein